MEQIEQIAKSTVNQLNQLYGKNYALFINHKLNGIVETRAKNKDRIYFNTKKAEELTEKEIRFVIQHEYIHLMFNARHPIFSQN